MLEGVVRKLQGLIPESTLYVINNRGNLKTEAWKWPSVVRQPPYDFKSPLKAVGGKRGRDVIVRSTLRLARRLMQDGSATNGIALHLPRWIVDPGSFELKEPIYAHTVGEYCRPFDALHVVGGGTMTDLFSWGLIKRCALIRAFVAQQKPVVLTGQQIGPFSSEQLRLLTKRTLMETRYISVREPTRSLSFCAQERIKGGMVTGDDSFGLPVERAAAVSRLSERDIAPGQFIAVNIRLGFYVPEHEKHVGDIASLVQTLGKQLDLPVLVVPIALGGRLPDIEAGYRLQEMIGDTVQVLDDADLTATAVKSVMGLAYGAVGISYHFCTFALSQGIPAVCIHDGAYYGQKAEGLAAFWGEPRINLPLAGLKVSEGSDRVMGVWQDDKLRQRLSNRAEEAVALWHDAFARDVVPALGRTA